MRNLLLLLCVFWSSLTARSQVIHFVFTSDVHYGITRPHFRGADSVPSYLVNAAQVQAIKSIPYVDAIVITGDIANREEKGIQAATGSWNQFLHDYRETLNKKLLVTPGNHDASNASSHPKVMFRDAGSMTGMFEIETGKHIDTSVYDYHTGKLNYSCDLGGVHYMFINIWPDSANRIWMEKDLAAISKKMPVLVFTHDPPEGDPKHFTNPNNNLFENLLDEVYKDMVPGGTISEQMGFIKFLKKHQNIKGYFHGHENFCEMYDYHGIPVFRSDSPLKGKISREDETKLSFQLVKADLRHHKLTVTEYLWNTKGKSGNFVFGKSRTVPL